jgi:plastocyanin
MRWQSSIRTLREARKTDKAADYFQSGEMNMKRIVLIAIVAVLIGGLGLLGRFPEIAKAASGAQPATGTEVKIDNFSFAPNTITVPVGTEVRWTNLDDIPHTVVSNDKAFKSKALDTDDQFTYTFTKAGTYKYFCSIHPKMTAEIVVQ